MSFLTAVVPEGEVPRSDVVAVRLARKVAPLFGVTWSGSPFGRTWVCDLAAVTLAEIGRGAPYPERGTQPGPTGTGQEPWAHVGRGVWTPDRAAAPATLPAATLNRFGPDTKAAVVLTAANRLLVDATAGIVDVGRHLAARDVHPVLRLAVWAGLVAEVYRGQPAVVVAAVQARAIQRSLTAHWRENVTLTDEPGLPPAARCELPLTGVDDGRDRAGSSTRPVAFDLIDATLAPFDLRLPATGPSSAVLTADRVDDLADAWCRRILKLGSPGRGITWLTETDGHRRVEAYLRVGAQVAPFIAEVLDGVPPPGGRPLPDLPDPGDLLTLPVQSRRAHLVAVHAMVNFLRYRDDLLQSFPSLREHTREHLERAVHLSTDVLGPGDPATLLITGYAHYVRLWDHLQTQASPAASAASSKRLADAVSQVQDFTDRLLVLPDGDPLDAGTVTYLLELGNVALAAAADRLERSPGLDRILARSWRSCLARRGLSDRQVLADPDAVHPVQAFHLQHFAAYHASLGGPRRLRQAYDLQRRVAQVRDEVARREPVGYAAKHTASRTAHELAASIAVALAQALPARETTARARAAADALQHARAVLANPTTPPLVTSGEPPAAVSSAARSVIPAIIAAESVSVPADLSQGQRDLVMAMLAAAVAATERDGVPRHAEDLTGWAARLSGAGWTMPSWVATTPGTRRRKRSS